MTAVNDDALWLSFGIAAPARRALVGAGLFTLAHVARVSRESIAELHGMGPSTLVILDRELASAGKSYGSKAARATQ